MNENRKSRAKIVLTLDEKGIVCNEITGRTLDILKLTHSLIYTIVAKMNISKTILKIIFEEAMRADIEGDGIITVDMKEFLKQVKDDDC